MTKDNDIVAGLMKRMQSGRLDGYEIEYWVGGGLPPPYYRSDQLRFLGIDGVDTLEFAKSRHDPAYDPPTVIDKWQLAAKPEDIREFLTILMGANAFTTHYPEETNPRVADILSTEIIVTAGEAQLTRRYYRRVPSALEPLRVFSEAIIERVKRGGHYGVYHKGRPVGS
jgi:hypothetical protein